MRRLQIIALVAALIVGVGVAFVAAKDHQMRSEPLAERLAATPIPSGFVLIEERSRDGEWLFKPRPPEAVALYAVEGDVDSVCDEVTDFYRAGSMEVSTIQRSPGSEPWCGRRVELRGESVTIWIEPYPSYLEVPAGLGDESDQVVRVEYRAHR